MSRISIVGLLLVAATEAGCLYPALKNGAGGADASGGSAAGSTAGATGSGGKGGSASGGKGGSASGGAAGASSGGKGGSAVGAAGASGTSGQGGSNDAGVRDAPVSPPDVSAGSGGTSAGGRSTGGTSNIGGTSTGGTSSTGGSGGSSSGAGPNCPALPDPANGTVLAPATTRGSTAVYSCDTGYNLSGSKTRTCQPDGTWNVAEPSCTIVDCGALGNPTNGTATVTTTTYGSTAAYSCNTGFGLAGTSPRTCQADATWSGTAPTCSPADCPTAPSPSNGKVTTSGTSFGSTATYSCNPGYNLSSTAGRTCLADGTWSGTTPGCTPVDCGLPPGLGYTGSVSSSATIYGSTATYTCSQGYSMTGAKTRTCQTDGTWSGTIPSCNVVDCGGAPNLSNATSSTTGTTYNSIVTYTCKTGYSMVGNPTRTCLADGTWSTPAPACAVVMLSLTIGKSGHGTGTVKSDTGDISCAASCPGVSASYAYGTNITLTATADTSTGQQFMGWTTTPNFTSCTDKVTSSCSFAINQDTMLSANFSPPPNYMFTTSKTYPVNLGGAAAADNICNQVAAAASLPGRYVAWLSTSTSSALSRLNGASGWVRPDGKPFLNSVADLLFSKVFYPPRLDESGHDLGTDQTAVMTNTYVDGAADTEEGLTNCGDFTSNVYDSKSLMAGLPSLASAMFTCQTSMSCAEQGRLYCFGIDRQAQIAVIPANGRYAFTTNAGWIPGGGIASADTLCQSEAATANLPGNYHALLAQSTASAASRFATNGLPWIRTDGIPITQTASAFFSTSLFDAPPSVGADKSSYWGNSLVWSGAPTPTTSGAAVVNCNDWTSASASLLGEAGSIHQSVTDRFFNGYGGVSCNIFYGHLLCLQD